MTEKLCCPCCDGRGTVLVTVDRAAVLAGKLVPHEDTCPWCEGKRIVEAKRARVFREICEVAEITRMQVPTDRISRMRLWRGRRPALRQRVLPFRHK